MKKKMKWILTMLTIMVALVLLLLPSDVEVTVRVPLPLERVMAEFETTERVKKWFNTADSGYTITIEKANPFEFIFVHEKLGKNTPLRFVVSPDTFVGSAGYDYFDGGNGANTVDLSKETEAILLTLDRNTS